MVGLLALLLFSGHHPVPALVNTAAIDATANATVDAEQRPGGGACCAPGPASAAPADPVIVAAAGHGGRLGGQRRGLRQQSAHRHGRSGRAHRPHDDVQHALGGSSLVGLRSSDNAVQLSFSGDGHTEYDQVSGDVLTLGFDTGLMTYQRCKT